MVQGREFPLVLDVADIPQHDLHLRRLAAGNPNTPEKVLSKLSQDHVNNVGHRVAENPRTPKEVLIKLASDQHSDVRLAVAENPSTPAEILAQLAQDADPDVRFGVAENPHMPEHILFKLSEDENPYIRCRALKTLQAMDPDVQARLKHMIQTALNTQNRRC